MKSVVGQIREYLNRLGHVGLSKHRRHQPEAQYAVIEALPNFYRPFVRPGALCFDVGANVGDRADVFLRLGARVICIEPQPSCVTILSDKYRNNPNATVIGAGLASKPGSMAFSICNTSNTISTFSEKWKTGRFSGYTWNDHINVNVISLDMLIDTYGIPDFCKIDVEGYEYEVLQGLSTPIKLLSFEFTSEFFVDAKLCVNYLNSIGNASFNFTLGDNLTKKTQFILEDWSSCDVLFKAISSMLSPMLWGDIYVKFY